MSENKFIGKLVSNSVEILQVNNNKIKPNVNVDVVVSSTNEMKKMAALAAITSWLAKNNCNSNIKLFGYGVSSDIAEQPSSFEITMNGAKNRLQNLKKTHPTNTKNITIYISLENGIMLENVDLTGLESDIFSDPENNNQVWVDRCVCIGELVYFEDVDGDVDSALLTSLEFSAVSIGVTTPLNQVLSSRDSNWTKTAGSFIATTFGFPSSDWHGKMAGKGREEIMREMIESCLA